MSLSCPQRPHLYSEKFTAGESVQVAGQVLQVAISLVCNLTPVSGCKTTLYCKMRIADSSLINDEAAASAQSLPSLRIEIRLLDCTA